MRTHFKQLMMLAVIRALACASVSAAAVSVARFARHKQGHPAILSTIGCGFLTDGTTKDDTFASRFAPRYEQIKLHWACKQHYGWWSRHVIEALR